MTKRAKRFFWAACTCALGLAVVALWWSSRFRSVSVSSPPSATASASPAPKLSHLSDDWRRAWSWALSQLAPEASKASDPECRPNYFEPLPGGAGLECRGVRIFRDPLKVCAIERVWGAARGVVQLSEGSPGRTVFVELPEPLSCEDIEGTARGDGECLLPKLKAFVQIGRSQAGHTVVQVTNLDGMRTCPGMPVPAASPAAKAAR
jgi:hypothetical protein